MVDQRHVCSNEDTASFLGAEVKINKIKYRLSDLGLGSEISDTGKERNSLQKAWIGLPTSHNSLMLFPNTVAFLCQEAWQHWHPRAISIHM